MARLCWAVLGGIFLLCIQNVAQGSGDLCFENSCFIITESGKTWKENRKICQSKGGDLVSIETIKKWKFINSEIQKLCIGQPNEWHIGLQLVGKTWKWVNGATRKITKWQKGEPSGDGTVAVMSKDYPPNTQGLFNDIKENTKRAFICETPKGTSR